MSISRLGPAFTLVYCLILSFALSEQLLTVDPSLHQRIHRTWFHGAAGPRDFPSPERRCVDRCSFAETAPLTKKKIKPVHM